MRFLTCCAFLLCTLSSVFAQTQDRADAVSVIGEVRKPGQFEVTQSISLFEAIALARGLTALANTRAIEITHNGTMRTVDFHAMLEGKTAMVHVEPGDTVRVPDHRRRN
jgi:protein involved in polysaccharide export with SLBB domain